MTNFRRQILLKMFMLLDPGMLTISYLVAAVLTWHLTEFTSFAAFFSMRIKLSNFLLFLGLFYFWHLIFSAFGLYGSRRLGERKEEVVVVLKATSAGALVLGFVAAFFRVRMITPAFIAVFWIVATFTIILSRLALREFLRRARMHGRNLRHLLIIGTNSRAVEFARAIEGRPELGYHLVGFADEEWIGNRGFGKNGKSIVSDLEHFSDFLRERVIDEVAIALPMKSFYSQAARIVAQCQEQGVIVRVLANIFDIQKGSASNSQHRRHGRGNLQPQFVRRLADGLQANAGHLCLFASAGPPRPGISDRRRTDQIGFDRAGVLRPGPRRPEQAALSNVQIPNHGGRRRGKSNPSWNP